MRKKKYFNGYKGNFCILNLKGPSKIAADNIFLINFYLSKKIRLDVSCKSSQAEDSHEISSLVLAEMSCFV